MVHFLLWKPTQDLHELICHICRILSQSHVPCTIHRKQKHVLKILNIDKPTPRSIEVDIEGTDIGGMFLNPKRGTHLYICSMCYKFGHLSSKYPLVLHKTPRTTIPLVSKRPPPVTSPNKSSGDKDKGKSTICQAPSTNIKPQCSLVISSLAIQLKTKENVAPMPHGSTPQKKYTPFE